MTAIEHEPTHIQTALSEQQEPVKMEGPFRKKGKKPEALGAFSRLLAGLVSKKAGLKPGDVPFQNGTEQAAGPEQGSPAFFRRGKQLKQAGESGDIVPALSQKKGPEQKRRKEIPIAAEEFAGLHLFPGQMAAETGAGPVHKEELVPAAEISLAEEPAKERTGKDREIPKYSFPFQNRESPELPPEGEIRNTAFHLKTEEEPVKENRGETGKAGRRRERFLDVRDLRTRTGPEVPEQALRNFEETRIEREIAMELRPFQEGAGETGGGAGENPQAEGNFERLLARELQGDLSSNIVKQAGVILRDGGEGTIRLSLKPETLGKVKIHLEMAENKITGHIFVESEEALRAFEQEIHTLEQAFRDSGFEQASLSTALDYRNSGHQWKENRPEPFFSRRFAAAGYDAESDRDMEASGGYVSVFGAAAVNVLA